MHLSYAQNLEDTMLDRVFSETPAGTYVDVGGGHPVADNVTFYFYMKGWSGLVVEPQADLANAYASVRPRDCVVAHLAGATDGEIDFHVVEGLHGLSSAKQDKAASASQYGAAYRTIRRRVRPLSHLIDDAGLTTIDVLKIDVEGAEADVIAGLDFARHRPRLICIEAVNPGAGADDWREWDATLRANAYTFAFFDNLNRYYVAVECSELAARFPPAVLDWGSVGHQWEHGRAAEKPDHPDSKLADVLVSGLFASLTSLSDQTLSHLIEAGLKSNALKTNTKAEFNAATATDLVGTAEWPGPDPTAPDALKSLLASDRFRAALGRMASMYDGGHL